MFLLHVPSYSQDILVLPMDSKDKSNNFKRLSDLPANNRRRKAKLLHSSRRRHSFPSTDKRSGFIRQKRIYKSFDNSDFNRLNVNSEDDQSYTTNHKLSGNQVNLIHSYFYNNYILLIK